jgi:hypothetical protein
MRLRSLWIAIVVGRLSAFLFTAIIALTGLFFLGNVQEFMDSTQILLLDLIDILSGVFLTTAVIYILLLIFEAIRQKRFFFGKTILALSGFLLVAIVFVFSNFLNSWL